MLTNADSQTVKMLAETENAIHQHCTLHFFFFYHLYLQAVNLIQMLFIRCVHLHTSYRLPCPPYYLYKTWVTAAEWMEKASRRANKNYEWIKQREEELKGFVFVHERNQKDAGSLKGGWDKNNVSTNKAPHWECCLLGRNSALASDDVSGFAQSMALKIGPPRKRDGSSQGAILK